MHVATHLGKAYAWQDGDQWFYAPVRKHAPENAIEVERYSADGALVLYVASGNGGHFIRGAKRWTPPRGRLG